MANVKATIVTSATPIVTKLLRNTPSKVNDITGLTIDFSTVAEGQVLSYDSVSNVFSAKSVLDTILIIDGGDVI
tara:strand:- start:232 stop:453 length:222 start_codon:yes stop_codon:yes gene_type:complete